MPSVTKMVGRARAIPWALAWEVGRSLWVNARDRVNDNLSKREREDFAKMVRKGRGRPWTLSTVERQRLVTLVKKAATGDSDASWDTVARSLATMLPSRLLPALWEHRASRR